MSIASVSTSAKMPARVTPEHSQHPDQRPAPHHCEGHGVVNEERAHDQGEHAQHGQVELEGLGHLRRDSGPAARRLHPQARWQRSLKLFDIHPRSEWPEIDAGERADRPQCLLRGGDVHHQDPRQRLPSELALGSQTAHQHEPHRATASHDRQRIADLHAQLACGVLSHHHRPGPQQEIDEEVRRTFSMPVHGARSGASKVVAERSLGKRVDAEQSQGLRRLGTAEHVALDHRRELPASGLAAELHVRRVRHPAWSADDLVGGPAGHRLVGDSKCSARAVDGDVHRHHHRHPEGDPDEGEAELPRMTERIAHARPPQGRAHATPSSSSPPSIRRTRSA